MGKPVTRFGAISFDTECFGLIAFDFLKNLVSQKFVHWGSRLQSRAGYNFGFYLAVMEVL